MKPLSIECPNLTCIINQSWPGCTWASLFEMELEPNSLDWNGNELEHKHELEDMKRTIKRFVLFPLCHLVWGIYNSFIDQKILKPWRQESGLWTLAELQIYPKYAHGQEMPKSNFLPTLAKLEKFSLLSWLSKRTKTQNPVPQKSS